MANDKRASGSDSLATGKPARYRVGLVKHVGQPDIDRLNWERPQTSAGSSRFLALDRAGMDQVAQCANLTFISSSRISLEPGLSPTAVLYWFGAATFRLL